MSVLDITEHDALIQAGSVYAFIPWTLQSAFTHRAIAALSDHIGEITEEVIFDAVKSYLPKHATCSIQMYNMPWVFNTCQDYHILPPHLRVHVTRFSKPWEGGSESFESFLIVGLHLQLSSNVAIGDSAIPTYYYGNEAHYGHDAIIKAHFNTGNYIKEFMNKHRRVFEPL